MPATTETTINTGAFLAVFIPVLIIAWAFAIVGIIAMWKIFTKAGQPGWAAIVPFYGTYVLLKTVGRPGWWLALCFVPIANIVIAILVMIDLAKAFGKDGGFAALLILLPFIGLPMLAFGNAVYQGPLADPHFVAWQYQQYGHQQYGYPQQPGYPQGYGYPQAYPQQQPGYPEQGHPQPPYQ